MNHVEGGFEIACTCTNLEIRTTKTKVSADRTLSNAIHMHTGYVYDLYAALPVIKLASHEQHIIAGILKF